MWLQVFIPKDAPVGPDSLTVAIIIISRPPTSFPSLQPPYPHNTEGPSIHMIACTVKHRFKTRISMLWMKLRIFELFSGSVSLKWTVWKMNGSELHQSQTSSPITRIVFHLYNKFKKNSICRRRVLYMVATSLFPSVRAKGNSIRCFKRKCFKLNLLMTTALLRLISAGWPQPAILLSHSLPSMITYSKYMVIIKAQTTLPSSSLHTTSFQT